MLLSLGFIPSAVYLSAHMDFSVKLNTEYADVLVVGGGTSGVIAAIQSARIGCKTIVLETGSQLGGTMTTGGVSFPGLFHAWGKQIISGIGWELVTETVSLNGDVLPDFTLPFGTHHSKHQIPLNGYLYSLIAEEKCIKAGVSIRYYETPTKIEWDGKYWRVEIVGKGTHYSISCKQLIDCTGNALVTDMTGYKLLREKNIQPGSLLFELDGFNVATLDFNELNARFKVALEQGSLLKSDAYNGIRGLLSAKGYFSVQHVPNADSTTSRLHTKANIEGRSSMLRIIRFVRTLPGCEKAYFKKIQPEVAIRETNRIDGEYSITCDDYVNGIVFPDSLAYSFYPIDLHDDSGVKPHHLQNGMVATIPYRALLPKNSHNIIVAGRCIASDRLANSALRVQASCMAMGQIAGCAAALSCMKDVPLKELDINDLKQLIRQNKGIVP